MLLPHSCVRVKITLVSSGLCLGRAASNHVPRNICHVSHMTGTAHPILRRCREDTFGRQRHSRHSLGALAHLPALALKTASTLLLPLPAHLGMGLLPRIRLVEEEAYSPK